MGRLSNIAGLFGDVKTRTIVIFVVVILFVGVGIGLTGLKQEASVGGAARTASVPGNIQNIPGSGQATAQYEALQVERNRQILEEAKRSGTSAIPTLTGTFTAVQPEPETRQTNQGETAEARLRRLREERMQREMANQTMLSAQQANATQQASAEEVRDAVSKSMGKSFKDVLDHWKSAPKQAYVQGDAAQHYRMTGDNEATQGSGASRSRHSGRAGGGSHRSQGEVLAKAGDLMFAVLDTSIDSDDQGEVLATVVSGKMKGAKIMGEYTATKNGQRIRLKFSKMNLPTAPHSITINAVAVNPFNGRSGLASSVDNHYLKRYGSLLISSLLQGYGEATKDQGNSVESTTTGLTVKSNPNRSQTDKFTIALGQVGKQLSGKVDSVFDTAPTVKVKEGVGLGILFLTDVNATGSGLS